MFIKNFKKETNLFEVCKGDKIKNRLAGTYCAWKSNERCINENMNTIDLEGVNSPNRGSFKITFGGYLKNYYNIKVNSFIKELETNNV